MTSWEQELKNKIAETGYTYYLRELDLAGIYTDKKAKQMQEKRDKAYDAFIHACQDYDDFFK